jgi:hypothetical protein
MEEYPEADTGQRITARYLSRMNILIPTGYFGLWAV